METVGGEVEPEVRDFDDREIRETLGCRLEFVVMDGAAGWTTRVERRDPEDATVLSCDTHELVDVFGAGAAIICSKVHDNGVRAARDRLSPLVHVGCPDRTLPGLDDASAVDDLTEFDAIEGVDEEGPMDQGALVAT